MIDTNTVAAKTFYGLVRTFAEAVKPWETALYYETKPDEVYDLSLVSQRVYGSRDEFMVILAAAGLSGFDQPLKQQRLVLPNSAQLYQMKRQSGFESVAALRENFAPTWAD